MITEFNAWTQPWIPIEKNDGTREDASIDYVLKNAHNIIAIRAAVPAETFGITRLLITILVDIYRPRRWDDIDNIRIGKKICIEDIDTYYAKCLSEGVVFDIFDKQKPFLQYAFPDKEKYKTKPAANLFDHLPTGNNVPHFIHNAEDSYSFTPARCLQTLCAIPFYEKHKRAEKGTTGINGVPPIYFLYNGKSLFDVLLVSMIPKCLYKENEFGLPIWRETNYFARGKVIIPEILHGLFSSPVKIQLRPMQDGLVREINVVDNGIDYSNVKWKDPHVAYKKDKNNNLEALKASNTRSVWRDLPIIIEPEALGFLFDWRYRNFNNEIIAYVKITENKANLYMPVSQFIEDIKIPVEIIYDEIKRTSYSNAIKTSDAIVSECGDILKEPVEVNNKKKKNPLADVLLPKSKKKKKNSFAVVLPPIFTEIFLYNIKEIFDSTLVSLLVAANSDDADWEKSINEFLSEKFNDTAINALNLTLDTISDDNVDTIILKNQLRKNVLIRLYLLLKKGGYINELRKKQ